MSSEAKDKVAGKDRSERWIRQEIAELSSYHVQPSDGFVKLDAMENPYAWPGELTEAWLERLKPAMLNRYPDPKAQKLAVKVRDYFGMPASLDLIFGNGSDELIQIMAMAVAGPGRTLLAPEPGFVMYGMIARFVGMNYAGVPLTEQFELDVSEMLAQIEAHDPALIFLAQPNNPTGNVFDLSATRAIIEAANGLVVIDEAYLPFTDANHLDLAAEYDNVVVMRTFSKMGLAGLRLGMLIGPPTWLTEFDKVRLPYNINTLTQVSAEFALENVHVLEAQALTLRESRQRLFDALNALEGVTAFPSEANFILLRLADGFGARDVFEHMKQQGVLVKCVDGGHPLLKNCLRFTVGAAAENDQMLLALESALQARSKP